MSSVRDVIDALKQRGTSGFRPSYIAQQAAMTEAAVGRELDEMVATGQLRHVHDLMCDGPECEGATVMMFDDLAEVPFDTEITCPDCYGEIYVRQQLIWTRYRPTDT